ncbi:MAG: tyrosine recombinase XerC [Clostridia bacterium]|nr:tyrosine recombinase XerC [Clostridia bacterium]MBO7398969.1 tyrosine recombinase XerC [Clostridia bacterium]MBR5005508.1 tyrosine recombinase XerC [Clostridia bacterium]
MADRNVPADDREELPIDTPLPYYAEEFLIYLENIRGKAESTGREYRYDLIMFFAYFAKREKKEYLDELDDDFIRGVTLSDLYRYINYLSRDRKLKPASRARKVASLRSFFKYLHSKAHVIEKNPTLDLETPKLTKKLPVYLELDESRQLLDSVGGENETRDFCILTLFLNCGMRLSELCGINISSIKENTLTVTGKGDKERTVYLNKACLEAIEAWLEVRPELDENAPDFDALFLSERKKRISPKTVQYTVKKYIMRAGLDPQKYSVHKLRHTAATLLYRYGHVDIRSLQEILGHESISTTEIYTHVNREMLADAVSKNPLSDYEPEPKED